MRQLVSAFECVRGCQAARVDVRVLVGSSVCLCSRCVCGCGSVRVGVRVLVGARVCTCSRWRVRVSEHAASGAREWV